MDLLVRAMLARVTGSVISGRPLPAKVLLNVRASGRVLLPYVNIPSCGEPTVGLGCRTGSGGLWNREALRPLPLGAAARYWFLHPGIALTSTMAAVINGNATANRMKAVPNDGACAAGVDGRAEEAMDVLPSGAVSDLLINQLDGSGCAAEHNGGFQRPG